MTAEVDDAVRAIAQLIPAEAVRHGWNFVDLTLDRTEAGQSWSVGLVGPQEAVSENLEFLGGARQVALMVYTGSHGRLRAPTLDDLCRLVTEWVAAIGVRS